MGEYQQELFDNLNRNKRSYKRRIKHSIFDRGNVRLSLSYEQIGIGIIIFIIFISIVFTLGVERGKQLNYDDKIAVYNTVKDIETPQEDSDDNSVLKVKSDSIKQSKEKISTDVYTVQVVTYKKDSLVEKELDYLKKSGYEAFVFDNSTKYKSICVGKYKNRVHAKKTIENLKKRYKDCFIKKIEGGI